MYYYGFLLSSLSIVRVTGIEMWLSWDKNRYNSVNLDLSHFICEESNKKRQSSSEALYHWFPVRATTVKVEN